MNAPAGSPGLILVALALVMTAGTLAPLALRRGDVPQPFARPTRSRRFREIGSGGNANARGDGPRALRHAGRAEVTVPDLDDAQQDTYDRLPLRDYLDQEMRRLHERIDRTETQRNELRLYLKGCADEDLRRLRSQIDRRLDDLSLIRDAVAASAPPTDPFRFERPAARAREERRLKRERRRREREARRDGPGAIPRPRVPTSPRRRAQRGVRRPAAMASEVVSANEGGAVEEDQLEAGLKQATTKNQPWPGVDDRHYGARDDRASGAT